MRLTITHNKREQLSQYAAIKLCECALCLSKYLIVLDSCFFMWWCEMIKSLHDDRGWGGWLKGLNVTVGHDCPLWQCVRRRIICFQTTVAMGHCRQLKPQKGKLRMREACYRGTMPYGFVLEVLKGHFKHGATWRPSTPCSRWPWLVCVGVAWFSFQIINYAFYLSDHWRK